MSAQNSQEVAGMGKYSVSELATWQTACLAFNCDWCSHAVKVEVSYDIGLTVTD